MGQLVLGLDLGSYSIKASLFETTFRNYELVNLFESSPLYIEDLDEEERGKVYRKALTNLITSNKLVPDVIVTALPGNVVSSRVLHFPFNDMKKINKSLAFELESYIPFPLESIIIGHHPVRREKNGASLIACAVQKEKLEAQLKLLSHCDIDPRIVDIDSLSLFNLLNISDTDPAGTYVLLDMGHSKTSLCIVKERRVKFIRTIFTGGQAVTDAIRYDFELVYKQAEKLKHRHGTIELEKQPLLTTEMRKISTSIRRAIDPLVQDVIQTIHAFQSGTHSPRGEKEKVDKILLSGGSALLPNLAGYIAQISNLPVESFSGFSSKPELKKRIGPREMVLHQAISLGLRSAIRGVNRNLLSRINFRQGEYAQRQELQNFARNFKKYGSWAAVIIFCFLLNIVVRNHLLTNRLKALEAQVVQVFNDTVKNFPKNQKLSASKAKKVMQGKLRENQDRYEVLTAGLKGVTALEILRAISAHIPDEVSVDISELNISSGKVFLRGETDSFASVDKIVAALKKFKNFGEIKPGQVKEGLVPKKKRFSLSIVIATEPK